MKSNLRGLKLVVQKQNFIHTVLSTTAIASKITFRNLSCTVFTGLVHRTVVERDTSNGCRSYDCQYENTRNISCNPHKLPNNYISKTSFCLIYLVLIDI